MNHKTKILLIALPIILFSFLPVEKRKVIFFGDSITEAGVQPGGYITQLREIVKKESRSDNFELIGAGIGGNKVYDLYFTSEKERKKKFKTQNCLKKQFVCRQMQMLRTG